MPSTQMDDTLASIRPSSNETMQKSTIYERDPSILACGQVNVPLKQSNKKLQSLFEDEESDSRGSYSSLQSISALSSTIRVYLRMRPLTKKAELTKEHEMAYEILDSNTLLTRLPSPDFNCSSFKRPKGNDTLSRKFTFTSTFGPETTQRQLFETIIEQQMINLLNGQTGTVMSYGTTNAGKSYTLQGTTSSPGIIPRALEFIFNNLNPRPVPCYKPLYNTEVVSLDASDQAYELDLKVKLLSFGPIDKSQYIQAYMAMQQILQNESPQKPCKISDSDYSIWVSFAEIYNETIHDLLSNDCPKKRVPLKLATDSNGKAFIKGLKMVCVNSGSEAYQLLMAGQYNLKVASTTLNARSSRSHSIFTVKLLKYHKENSPAHVEVSTFSFCDLAGSERLKKTLNAGERLKEAQNINTSLLVLGRCLKSIFEGQVAKPKYEVIGPFRESKLTRLFQSALSGKEHIALIVNVNPSPDLHVETQNVLNFSAIAKQIVVEPVARAKRRTSSTRFSQLVSQSIKTVTDWDLTKFESVIGDESCASTERAEYIHLEEYDEVVRENKKLKKEIAKLKVSLLNTDFEIRDEMSKMYSVIISDLETNFKNRLQDMEEQQEEMLEWSVEQLKDYYEAKLNLLSQRQQSSLSLSTDAEENASIEELEAENTQLTAKIETLKKSVKELRESEEKLKLENNHIVLELSLVKKDLQNCRTLLIAAQNDISCSEEPSRIIEELKKQLSAREEQIKSLKEYLDEAKAEWLRITEVESELEKTIEKRDEQLMKATELIADLSEQIEQANICLVGSTKNIEDLEEKLEAYAKVLADAEEKSHNAEDRWHKSDANCLVLYNEKEKLQKCLDEEIARAQDTQVNSAADDSIKKEQLLELGKLKDELGGITLEVKDLKELIAIKDEKMEGLKSKVLDGENENALLKQRLLQSSNHTKDLREELNLTKATLCEITEQIKSLKDVEAAKTASKNADCQTSFVFSDDANAKDNWDTIKIEVINDEYEPQDESAKLLKVISSRMIENKVDKIVSPKVKKFEGDHGDLKEENPSESVLVKELSQKLSDAEQRYVSLQTSFESCQREIAEYKNSLQLVESEMHNSGTQLINTIKKLEETEREKEDLTSKLMQYEIELLELQNYKKHWEDKDREKSEVMEITLKKVASLEIELSKTLEKLQEVSTKCILEHINYITNLENDISAAKQRDAEKEQLLKSHVGKITKLEENLEEIGDLQKQIAMLDDQLKICEAEKAHLQIKLDKDYEQLKSLENELQASMSREQEKEAETLSLQREMKTLIQLNSRDSVMEKEVKDTLQELERAKKSLAETEAALIRLDKSSQLKIEKLEMQIQTLEQNADHVALLHESANDKEADTKLLRIKYDDLRRKFDDKEREMESFSKNRDETIQRYEALVEQLREDISKNTGELKKSQSMEEEKENVVHTSEDESTKHEVHSKQRRRKNVPGLIAQTNADIELSGSERSESKRVTRRTALALPTIPSSEKRKPRKKKLFALQEDNYLDLEASECVPKPEPASSPPMPSRILRNRRK
ncbi:kinesin-like protein KIF20B isoform X1 [Athalia rosae]|uniref:kinesin-like protein KIF20B isoform X1 n=2 Tax=Athalia rosae TaxID=37344 RepID=UPI002033D7A5|nr:kinesin-like protein KIF20B isoform X1 [Athalia rosae]